MTIFDDRKRSYEAKFAHDAELRFKAQARRNQLLGDWAAGLLGKTGDEVQEYIRAVIASDFQEAGDDDVARKLIADLEGKADEQTVRAKIAELQLLAREQIANES